MRGDDGILIRGRFRHGDGGMGLGMERHPWNGRDLPTNTGVAGSNSSPGTNAHRGGQINTLRRSGPASSNLGLARQIEVARGAQQASRRHPPLSRAAVPGNLLHEHESGRNGREMSMGRWYRVWKRACLQACCGNELEEEGGGEMMQVRVVDMAGDGR